MPRRTAQDLSETQVRHEIDAAPEWIDEGERQLSRVVLVHVHAEPCVPTPLGKTRRFSSVDRETKASIAECRAGFDQCVIHDEEEACAAVGSLDAPHLPSPKHVTVKRAGCDCLLVAEPNYFPRARCVRTHLPLQ
jgi:hypothetical protein